ncbi:hypothetical protein RclHR1_08320006 [Rhizophagus clarus]|uniref:Uncharacterized protein n=1 Tax=Rhizophagus clarus TaxID=94130 RepID=A0A2Z6SMX1_9GLOM|nr:hypothetical protein RclHR1_08320006 [Rhizophagus clarus]
MSDFIDTFDIILDDKNFKWAIQYSSLFAKDASKKEYQAYIGNFVPSIVKEHFNKIADKWKYNKNLLYILFRTTFPVHEDAFKFAAALYKDNGSRKDILDNSYDPHWLSDKFIDMEISVNKKHQSQFSAASTSTNQNKDRTSWKLDKQKAKVVEQVIPDILVPDPESVTKENSKDLGDDAIQIITGYHPNPSLGQYVHDILIYDIPANWENITILNYLKAWGNVILVTVKKQKKYKTVRCKFQAIIEGPPDSLTADTLANKKHLTNFINPLHIKAFKEVKNPDGTCKMIAYFESWKNLQNIISKESFWNGTKLSWYHHIVPFFIMRRRSNQWFSSNRQDKPNKLNLDSPPKYTKVSLGSKIGSPATGSNRIPIRSPQKDSSQSSSGCKTKGKNKKNQKMKNKSTSTFLPKKLSK